VDGKKNRSQIEGLIEVYSIGASHKGKTVLPKLPWVRVTRNPDGLVGTNEIMLLVVVYMSNFIACR
jgi:hypothetical protein